jgi:hypothetical protein
MPGIAHLVFGLFIAIPIMFMLKDKLNYKVAVIFVLNNWMGPDSYWPYRYIPFDMHALIGFAIWAIPLSLYYSYLSRFSFKRSNHFFTIVDDGKRDVKWRNAYFLCIAGGICHTLIDAFFHFDIHTLIGSQSFDFLEGWQITFKNFLGLGVSLIISADALIVLGYIIMLTISLLIIYFFKKEIKDILVFLFTIIGLVFLSIFTLGLQVFGEEGEGGAIIFSCLFVFVPLMLFAYVAKDVQQNPTNFSEKSVNSTFKLHFIAVITCILGVLFFLLGLSGMIAPDLVKELLNLSNNILFGIGLAVTILASIGIIGGIGLFFRIPLCRYFAIFLSILLLIFVFPFAIALTLCQKDVKELFQKKPIEV